MKKLILTFLAAFLFIPLNVSASFTDLPDDHPNKPAIDYLAELDVLRGDDLTGNVRADDRINRAEFLVALLRLEEDEDYEGPVSYCFSDVEAQWFSPKVCEAKFKGIVEGHPNGEYRPWEFIKFVEAIKIISIILDIPTQTAEGEEWFDSYLNVLSDRNAIPDSITSLEHEITRGEMAEMAWRLSTNRTDRPFVTAQQLKSSPCQSLGEDLPSNIDMDRFRNEWLRWTNEARATQGRYHYTLNSQLHRTATDWSNLAAVRGYIDHRRDPGDGYYDYWKITSWFENLGLTFKNVNRVTHTENIGWDVYRCDQADCTDYALGQVRNVFDFYMREGPGGAHYDSIMNSQFNEIGIGVALGNGRIFITIHYGTEITSNPERVCGF